MPSWLKKTIMVLGALSAAFSALAPMLGIDPGVAGHVSSAAGELAAIAAALFHDVPGRS
jgi:hypothetical protein